MESNVKKTIEEIKDNLAQQRSSVKDETIVMRAMLNDKDFKVDVYGNDNNVIDTVCPYDEAREMISSVISRTTKISPAEAQALAGNHQFNKNEAENMTVISKEFINTYLDCGRKLSLGKRKDSDISLIPKEVAEKTRFYPKKDADGNWVKDKVVIPAHKTVKIKSPCPTWYDGNEDDE